MVQAASSTSTGAGGRSPTQGKTAGRSTGTTVRQRKTTTTTAKKPGASTAGMWRFYTEDSPGIKVLEFLDVFTIS